MARGRGRKCALAGIQTDRTFTFDNDVTAWVRIAGGNREGVRTRLAIHVGATGMLEFTFTMSDGFAQGGTKGDVWRHQLARGELLTFAQSVHRFGQWEPWCEEGELEVSAVDRMRLSVWLDQLESKGLAGLGADKPRAFVMDDDESIEDQPLVEETLTVGLKPNDSAAQFIAKALREQQRDVAEREAAAFEEERGKKKARPAEGTAKELEGNQRGVPSVVLLGSRTQPIREYAKTNATPTAIARWVSEAPKVLKDEGRIFDLVSADETEGRLKYELRVVKPQARDSGPPRRVMPVKPVKVPVVAERPTSIGPATRAFFPTAKSNAEREFEAEKAAEEAKKAAEEAAINFRRNVSTEEMLDSQREGGSLFLTENRGPHSIERLYRIPRLEMMSWAEQVFNAPLIASLMPARLTIDGKDFTRGQLHTITRLGQPTLVVAYNHTLPTSPFQPYIPTVMEQAANEAWLRVVAPLVNPYRTEIRPATSWRNDSATEVVFKEPGLSKVRAVGPDGRVRTPRGLRLHHLPRAERVAVALTVEGNKQVAQIPIAQLRANQSEFQVGPWRVELESGEATALSAWLAKSANAGLGKWDWFGEQETMTEKGALDAKEYVEMLKSTQPPEKIRGLISHAMENFHHGTFHAADDSRLTREDLAEWLQAFRGELAAARAQLNWRLADGGVP